MVNSIINQINKLTLILGIGGMNGTISLASLASLFKMENAFMISVLFMAGPGAITTAFLLDGDMKERILAALFAGMIATIIVVLAAGIGTKAISFLNLNVLRISGGIAVLLIGFLIMGVKIPDKIPLGIVLLGVVLGAILK